MSVPDGSEGHRTAVTTGAVRSGHALLIRYVATGAISLAGATALLRLIGPEAWAPYAVAYFLVTFAERELGNRILGAIVRDGGAPPTPASLATAAAVMTGIGLAIVTLLLAVAGIVSLTDGLPGLALCLVGAGVSALVFVLRAVPVAELERQLNYRRVAAAEIVDQVTFFAFAVPLCVYDPRVEWLALALALRGVPATIAVRLGSDAPLVGRIDRAELSGILAFALPGLATAMAVLIEGLVPLITLGDSTELGLFMSAASIIGYPAVVHVIVHRLSFPVFARLSGTAGAVSEAVQRTNGLAGFALASLIVPAGGFGPLWIPWLLGDVWADSAGALAIIGLGYLCGGTISIAGGALVAMGRPGVLTRVMSVTTAGYLAGALLLGGGTAEGVAWVYLASRVVGLIVTLSAVKQQGGGNPLPRALAVVVGAAVGTGSLYVAADAEQWAALALTASCVAVAWCAWVAGQAAELRVLARR